MVFSRSRSFDFPPEFSIRDSELLTEKKEATILGVKIQSSLCWDLQVEHMVASWTS